LTPVLPPGIGSTISFTFDSCFHPPGPLEKPRFDHFLMFFLVVSIFRPQPFNVPVHSLTRDWWFAVLGPLQMFECLFLAVLNTFLRSICEASTPEGRRRIYPQNKFCTLQRVPPVSTQIPANGTETSPRHCRADAAKFTSDHRIHTSSHGLV